MRAPLRYFGGKWRLAPQILPHFPPHQCYVEPCCGGASVLLRKQHSRIEVISDIAGDVVTWWRVLRERTDELVDALALTPYAAAEFDDAHIVDPDMGDVERARRFFIRSVQGVGGVRESMRRTGWRRTLPRTRRVTVIGDEWHSDTLLEALYAAADRLRRVAIEQGDWMDVVRRYDHPETLIYLDPPYVASTRSYGQEYSVEWSDADHERALRFLSDAQGMVAISGYRCAIYDDLLAGWARFDFDVAVNGMGSSRRIDSLWLSPRCAEAGGQGVLL